MKRHSSVDNCRFLAVGLVLGAILVLAPGNGGAEPCGVEGEIVREVELVGIRSVRKSAVLNLLGDPEGATCDRRVLRTGLRRLFQKGLFDELRAERVDLTEGMRLRIVAVEKPRIRSITVTGNENIAAGRILRELPLRRWEFFREDDLGPALSILEKRLRRLGYPRTTVSGETIRATKSGDVGIVIEVNEGRAALITDLVIEGAPNPRVAAVKVFLRPGDVLNEEKIDQDRERLEEYLVEKGYLGVRVTPSVEEGRLVFHVQPGPKVEVSFEGNERFKASALEEEVFLGERGDLPLESINDAVEESARRIVRFLRKEGFPFAGVATEIEQTESRIHVRFFVHEGVKSVVQGVTIVGAGEHEELLRSTIGTKKGNLYAESGVEDDEKAIVGTLNRLGFLSATLGPTEARFSEDGSSVELTYHVVPGLRSWIREIRVKGMETFTPAAVLRELGLEEGQPYDEVKLVDTRYRLLDRYVQSGYPWASVELKAEFSPDGEWGTVIFEVKEGDRHRFGKVIVRGNRRTRDEVIIRELGVEEGALFSPSLLPLGKRALYQLGIFSEVKVETLDNVRGYKDVLVTVQEAKPGAVEFGFGYGDYDRFRVSAEIKYGNLWGVNRSVSLRGEYGSRARRVLFTYKDPWTLRDQNLPLSSVFVIERTEEVNQDTRDVLWQQRRLGVTVTADKNFTENLQGSVAYEYLFQDTFDVSPDAVLSPEDEGTVGISSMNASLVRDTRDNPFDPRKGTVTGAVLKVATRYLLSETDFVKLTLQHSRFQAHAYRIVSALSLRIGVAEGLHETDALPIGQRFFLGGRTTVRGFEQWEVGPKGPEGNPTGGNAFVNVNFELRFPIWRDLGGVTFIDGGNVWVEVKDLDPTDLRFAAGAGVRYATPVGPLRVDYGFKLDRKDGESAGELHFSIGHAF